MRKIKSNNKVKIGGGMRRPRSPNFGTKETKLLISLWGDPKVQKRLTSTKSRKKHRKIFTKLTDKMREHGYRRSPEEVRTHISNLKSFYNRNKKELKTGIRNETAWHHYAAMDEILTGQHLQNSNTFKFTAEDVDGKDLAPEDLLSVEDDFDEDIDFDDGSILAKWKFIDIDDVNEVNVEDYELVQRVHICL